MEVNPRLWQWHGLASVCGVDLPMIAYLDLIGQPPAPVTMVGEGRRWAITLIAGTRNGSSGLPTPTPCGPPMIPLLLSRRQRGRCPRRPAGIPAPGFTSLATCSAHDRRVAAQGPVGDRHAALRLARIRRQGRLPVRCAAALRSSPGSSSKLAITEPSGTGSRRSAGLRRRCRRHRRQCLLASLPMGGAAGLADRSARSVPGGCRAGRTRRPPPWTRWRRSFAPPSGCISISASSRWLSPTTLTRPGVWYGRRAVMGAGARAKRAAIGRRVGDLGTELAGLLEAPVHRLRKSDPNWAFERIAEIERGHGGRSTYFVMTGHSHPADGACSRAYNRRRQRL